LSGATEILYVNSMVFVLINYVEIEIGGQKIDKHYSHWMYIWNELSLPLSKRDGYYEYGWCIGGVPGTDME
jgi:hypothetical protein